MTTSRISALLIDLSGTLHVGSEATPRAVQALHKLRQSGIPFRFCSNTSKESTQELTSRLEIIGFDVRQDRNEIWTSIGALRRALEQQGLKRPYFLLTDSARRECVPEEEIATTSGHDSVVVGLAPSQFNYENMNAAFRILMEEGTSGRRVPLIATHKAKFIGASDGGLSLGPGPFVAALENATGIQAQVVGKPTGKFFETVIADFTDEELGNRGHKIAIVGDDVEADLGEGAVELGLWRVLVKTGKYREGAEIRPGIVHPDAVFDSFADFVDDLLKQ